MVDSFSKNFRKVNPAEVHVVDDQIAAQVSSNQGSKAAPKVAAPPAKPNVNLCKVLPPGGHDAHGGTCSSKFGVLFKGDLQEFCFDSQRQADAFIKSLNQCY
jgi:hypothetical protein